VGDEHVGSSLALSPPRVRLDDGGWHEASPLQAFYWECWLRFWDDTAEMARRLRARVVAISGGDERDGDHHQTTQLCLHNEDDQDRAVYETLKVAQGVVDEWHFVRGTPAHDGPASAATERYARTLAGLGWNVVPDGDRWSHWCYTGVHEGVKVEVAHAPGTKSWVPTTRGATCARHAQYTRAEYMESGVEPPDVVVRHHVHYWQGPGCDGPVCCFFVPGWQAATAYVMGRGVKAKPPSVFIPGGLRVVCDRGMWWHRWRLYRPPSGVAWART
jgi:hypothetical protein